MVALFLTVPVAIAPAIGSAMARRRPRAGSRRPSRYAGPRVPGAQGLPLGDRVVHFDRSGEGHLHHAVPMDTSVWRYWNAPASAFLVLVRRSVVQARHKNGQSGMSYRRTRGLFARPSIARGPLR